MGWLTARRHRVLQRLQASTVCLAHPDIVLAPTRGGCVKPGSLPIRAPAMPIDIRELRLHGRHQCVRIISRDDCDVRGLPLDCGGFLRTVELVPPETADLHIVDIGAFHAETTWFGFGQRRKEPSTLLVRTRARGARPRPATRAQAPPPPPDAMKGVELRERLRWILTPPIDELVTDPQLALPYPPYPFQTIGIKWLYDRSSALLADEMGLGKTMQAIIAGRLLWRESLIDQMLVVCPKSLIPNWQEEITKWWPQASQSIMLPGNDRQWFLRMGTPNVIVKIINYAALARELDWIEDEQFSHGLIVIDEAQKIKNPGAKQSRAVKALKGSRRWALTGTPLENRPADIVSIFDFVRPNLLASDDPEEIRTLIPPHILRRRADEVLDDLPEKSELDIEIELSAAHRETYEQMEQEGVVTLNAKGESITVAHVFSLIAKLRQICNFDPVSGLSAKLERLLDELEEITESGRKALIFSQFVSEEYGLLRLAKELGRRGIGACQLHGKVAPHLRPSTIAAFRADERKTVMLLNYQVGGLGLNLQAANYVFLFDRWWNPAVEDQAIKRVHRIGQKEKVFVRRFFCSDTIEERILRKLAEKRRLFRHIIDEASPQADSLGLTEEEIFSLFNLAVRPRAVPAKRSPRELILGNLSPDDFEILVAEVYEEQGYEVSLVGGSHDMGVDVVAKRETRAAREHIVIQCKHQQANVGRPVLQQLWGVVSADPQITTGVLVTSSGFTSDAESFARGKRLGLVGGDQLAQLATELGVASFVAPPKEKQL